MHKRMTRILSAISLLAVIPAVAFGSAARVSGLNVPGDYIKDYTGIFTYVSGVGSVGNLVYVEPGDPNFGNADQAVGAVLGNLWEGRLGTWGIHLRQSHPQLGQPGVSNSFATSNIFSDPNQNGEALDIMWGRKMGNGNLGLRVNRSFFSFEDATGTVEGGSGNRNVWGFGAGYGWAMNENVDIELGGLYQNRSFDDPPVADDGGTTYELALRAMMKAGSNLMIMPVGKLYSFDLSEVDNTVPATPVSTDTKLTGWEIGLAGNWTIGTDDLFVLGAQFAGNKFESTTSPNPTASINETYYPNVFMALESHVNSWLTLRFGAQNAVFYSIKTEGGVLPGDPSTIKTHSFTYNMGAGVKLGSLQLDATLEPNFWNNPIANSWNNPGGTPFGKVSATYAF